MGCMDRTQKCTSNVTIRITFNLGTTACDKLPPKGCTWRLARVITTSARQDPSSALSTSWAWEHLQAAIARCVVGGRVFFKWGVRRGLFAVYRQCTNVLLSASDWRRNQYT